MNGIIDGIKCAHSIELNIDCGDTYISISKRGTFDGKKQYSWTQTSASSGPDMEYESFLITKEDILTNISLLAEDVISNEQQEAVKLFFGD
jgi:hypothetical protein